MKTFQCTACNAPLPMDDFQTVIHCQYCGATTERPRDNATDDIVIQIPLKPGESSTRIFTMENSTVTLSNSNSGDYAQIKTSLHANQIASTLTNLNSLATTFSQKTLPNAARTIRWMVIMIFLMFAFGRLAYRYLSPSPSVPASPVYIQPKPFEAPPQTKTQIHQEPQKMYPHSTSVSSSHELTS